MENTRFNWFAIVITLPAQDDAGKVLNDVTGQPIYQTNYFCKLNKDEIPGLVLNEWDTDKRFAYRFIDAATAETFRRVVLESLEGSSVVELIPQPLNGKRLLS